jgi:CBS domain-containing protein
MLVKDVMTKDLACCTPQQSVVDAAKLMKKADVGAIPVVDSLQSKKLLGIVTDRDICIQVVAESLDPKSVKVEKYMSKDLVTASADEDLDRCAQLMQENQVRRIPVVDEKGILVGIVAQADIAQEAESPDTVKETVQQVSRPGKREAA